MNVFITYSNKKYDRAKQLALFAARHFGKFDRCVGYSPEDIDPAFCKQHQDIFAHQRGNGLWLWKPYFIKQMLNELEEGDFLFYSDAGAFFIRPIHAIINSLDSSGVWLSDIPLLEKQFTKPELFHNLGTVDRHYYDTNIFQAGFVGVRKSGDTERFIEEWLGACSRIENLDALSGSTREAEQNQFIAHREDQSVLSLLAKKHGIKPHMDPTQFSKIPEKYQGENRIFRIPEHEEAMPVSLVLHRTPDANLKVILNQWIFAWMPGKAIRAIQTVKGAISSRKRPAEKISQVRQ